MKGDFSRFTYNSLSNYTSVFKQQGRIDLDSDWNEQAELWSETFRQLAADILGQFAVPLAPNDCVADNSHALAITDYRLGAGGVIDFKIGQGLAYIGGYPYRLAGNITYQAQPDFPEPDMPPDEGDLLIYIEVWRKSVNYIDDELIRDPALGGPDTCLRSKIIGQIRILGISDIDDAHAAYEYLGRNQQQTNINLTLQIDQSALQIPLSFGEIEPSGGIIPGNLHYRLELQRGIKPDGVACEGVKWSDENAALAARIVRSIDNRNFIIEEPEPIFGESFKTDDCVEFANVITELHRQGSQIAMILNVENVEGGVLVTVDTDIHPILVRRNNGARSAYDLALSPRIRRWSGFISPLTLKNIYDLGRGVKAVFGSTERKHGFEPGDYWSFALRDRDYNKLHAPDKASPSGIRKFRHPLAILRRGSNRQYADIVDCRRFFKPIAAFKI